MNKNIIKILSWLLGIIALIILIYRIHQSLTKQGFQNSVYLLLNHQNVLYLILTILLMPVNWLIESRKWYLITQSVEKISFKTSVASVLTGLAYGHLLPARSSEFIGKLFFFSEKNKKDITALHFINAAFQMYITISAGIVFMLFNLNIPYSYHITFFSIIIFILLNLLLIYSDKLNFLSKKYFVFQYNISTLLKIKLITWSILRYIIFILQFYFVFLIYNAHQNLDIEFVSKLSVYFLLTSVIPMVSIIEVFIRAVIGIVTLQGLGINEIQITFITTLIWLINLAIPSIIGFVIWIFLPKK